MKETALLNPTAPADLQPAEGRGNLAFNPLHNSKVELSANASIYDPIEIGLPAFGSRGEQLSILGEVNLLGHTSQYSASIIKMRSALGDESVFIAGLRTDEQNNKTVMPMGHWLHLGENRPVVLGREPQAEVMSDDGKILYGEPFDTGISRKHLSVTLKNGKVVIVDSSSNGTTYYGKSAELQEDPYNYKSTHTLSAQEAARLRGLLNKQTYEVDGSDMPELFAGRPTIGRDTFPIDGHVDIRSWIGGGEAIVVDSKKYPAEFDKLRAEFDTKLQALKQKAEKGGFRKMIGRKAPAAETTERDAVLEAIYETVNEAMTYDLDFVNKESEDLKHKSVSHRKAALNNYLQDGKGVCRHMALAVSWLGGDAVERGLIGGRFTTEVNQSNLGNGAHEWSRYVSPEGEIYIIDVAQHYQGKLIDTLDKKRNGKEHWGYFRNGQERDMFRVKRSGQVLTDFSGLTPFTTTEQNIITENDVPH